MSAPLLAADPGADHRDHLRSLQASRSSRLGGLSGGNDEHVELGVDALGLTPRTPHDAL